MEVYGWMRRKAQRLHKESKESEIIIATFNHIRERRTKFTLEISFALSVINDKVERAFSGTPYLAMLDRR